MPFNLNIGQFWSKAEIEQSTEVSRLHKAELVWSSESGAGNQMESVKDAVREKTKYSEYSTPKLYRGLYSKWYYQMQHDFGNRTIVKS